MRTDNSFCHFYLFYFFWHASVNEQLWDEKRWITAHLGADWCNRQTICECFYTPSPGDFLVSECSAAGHSEDHAQPPLCWLCLTEPQPVSVCAAPLCSLPTAHSILLSLASLQCIHYAVPPPWISAPFSPSAIILHSQNCFLWSLWTIQILHTVYWVLCSYSRERES